MAWIPLAPSLKQSYWILVALGALYVSFLGLLTVPWAQRQALYAHNFNTAGWWHNLSEPEQFGFLQGQIQEAWIPTSDGESLYGWHILPVGAYSRHERELIVASSSSSSSWSPESDSDGSSITSADSYRSSTALDLLKSDPEAMLIINFHGNAGHVGQGWRTDTYRALIAADPEHAHVFTFDYRGFGHSTGVPNEVGLIRDGVTVVKYFLEFMPAERIVLVGNSLGVAVTIATVEKMQQEQEERQQQQKDVASLNFAGLVLVAGFSDLISLLSTYAILHAIPIFSPMRPYPWLRKFFERRIIDTWPSSQRLQNYVKQVLGERPAGRKGTGASSSSTTANIAFIHSRTDYDIPVLHATELFVTAANATSTEGLTRQQITNSAENQPLRRGGFINTWKAEGKYGNLLKLKQIVLRDGGHNRIMTFGAVTQAVRDAFTARA